MALKLLLPQDAMKSWHVVSFDTSMSAISREYVQGVYETDD